MKYPAIKFVSALFFILNLITSCKKEDAPVTPVDLAQVRLADFKLQEVNYLTIDINHPVVHNGTETQRGSILITIPKGASQLQLTPMPLNFTHDGFTVSPALGIQQNFSGAPVSYTIRSKVDPGKWIHYDVTITEIDVQGQDEPGVTEFLLKKANNPTLPADIAAARIVHGEATMGKIYLFVPEGTSFSGLVPTITYQGEGLYYLQDAAGSPDNATTVYPAAGMPIDFTFPKVFYAVVKGSGFVKSYEVIIDVKDPLRFENSVVTLPDVARGSSHFVQATHVVNRGNHPLTIAGVEHIETLPAGITAIRGSATIPSSGLLPGERSQVFATISAQIYPPGPYQVTAVFTPRLFNQFEADGLMEASSLKLQTNIIN